MTMPTLIDAPQAARVVNVAQVPQYSPFRYPGGKSWFIPRLRRWLASRPRPAVFAEPFAGGGSSACTVAIENLADRVVINELDPRVAAVWKVIFSDAAPDFAQRIRTFDMTAEAASAILASEPTGVFELAWRSFVQNRVSHGGIIAPGGGVLKHGEGGKGVRSRWYPDTLANRVLALHAVRDRVEVQQRDALALIGELHGDDGAAVFIDPPYSAGGKAAGKRLYTHWQLDHARLFELAAGLSDPVMTYDVADDVRALAAQHGLRVKPIAMKTTHHAILDELLIGKNLGWDV